MDRIVSSNVTERQLFEQGESSYVNFQEFLSQVLQPLEDQEPFKSYFKSLKKQYVSNKEEFFQAVESASFKSHVPRGSVQSDFYSSDEVASFEENCVLIKRFPHVDSALLDSIQTEMYKHYEFQKEFDERFQGSLTENNMRVIKSFAQSYYSLPFTPSLIKLMKANTEFIVSSMGTLSGVPGNQLMYLSHNFVVEPGRKSTHPHKDFDTIYAHRYRAEDIREAASVRYVTYNLAITGVNAANTPLYILSGDSDMITPRYSLYKARDEIFRFHESRNCTENDLLKALAFAELGGRLNMIDLQSCGNYLNYPFYKATSGENANKTAIFVENERGSGFFLTSNKNLHCSYTENQDDEYRMTSSVRFFTEEFLKSFYGNRRGMEAAIRTYVKVLSVIFCVDEQLVAETFGVDSVEILKVPMCIQVDDESTVGEYQGVTAGAWQRFFDLEPVQTFLAQDNYSASLDNIERNIARLG